MSTELLVEIILAPFTLYGIYRFAVVVAAYLERRTK